MKIAENIAAVKRDMHTFAPNRAVRLIAVTKTVGISEIREAIRAGVGDLAESKVQVLEQKVRDLGPGAQVTWHFIGHLQTNKVKKVVPLVDYIHSVDSVRLAEYIDKYSGYYGKRVKVFLEINISGEENKYGFSKEELISRLADLKKLKNLAIIGLMTMAPFGASDEELHNLFGEVARLQERINTEQAPFTLTDLSMGMSQDYRIALQEGATMIRVGSSIFS